jgi:hypothetical protein
VDEIGSLGATGEILLLNHQAEEQENNESKDASWTCPEEIEFHRPTGELGEANAEGEDEDQCGHNDNGFDKGHFD